MRSRSRRSIRSRRRMLRAGDDSIEAACSLQLEKKRAGSRRLRAGAPRLSIWAELGHRMERLSRISR